jgi:hypothetical protein
MMLGKYYDVAQWYEYVTRNTLMAERETTEEGRVSRKKMGVVEGRVVEEVRVI